MKSSIQSIRADGKITKEVLLELGTDPELEGYLIACLFKDGTYSVGWSEMSNLELSLAVLKIDHEVKQSLFYETPFDQ